MVESPQKPWRKNLYENLGYEDNYTDVSFLQDLRTNVNVRICSFSEALHGATRLNSQISCITGFLIIFYAMYNNVVTPTWVLLPSVFGSILGYLLFPKDDKLQLRKLVDDSKTLMTVLLFGYMFAPLLHTLTGAISTDTIFSMTFFVMLVNLICHDYGLSVAIMPRAISVTAAIFGSICLASRLSTSYHAFVLLVVSVIFFVLYPMLNTIFWQTPFMLCISAVCGYAIFHISCTVCCIYVATIIFVNFVCPFIFVRQQRFKQNIHGPWDEAMVDLNFESSVDGV